MQVIKETTPLRGFNPQSGASSGTHRTRKARLRLLVLGSANPHHILRRCRFLDCGNHTILRDSHLDVLDWNYEDGEYRHAGKLFQVNREHDRRILLLVVSEVLTPARARVRMQRSERGVRCLHDLELALRKLCMGDAYTQQQDQENCPDTPHRSLPAFLSAVRTSGISEQSLLSIESIVNRQRIPTEASGSVGD
jgi:hypothetical protein